MATRLYSLLYFLFLLSSSTLTLSLSLKITPRFPSSIITPEHLSVSTQNTLYRTKYFTQILDHFNYNPQSYQTFQHRYLINDTHWGGPKNNSPIFVYTGNEGDIEWFTQNTGFMFENAPHFKALLVFIEVRNELHFSFLYLHSADKLHTAIWECNLGPKLKDILVGGCDKGPGTKLFCWYGNCSIGFMGNQYHMVGMKRWHIRMQVHLGI